MGNSDNPLGENGSRAFALFVLADLGKADTGAMAKLFAERATLPVFGEALLLRAMARARSDKGNIDVLMKDLLSHASPVAGNAGAVRISDPKQKDLWWYMSSDTRTSALTLQALLEVDPQSELVPKLVRGLLAARQGGRWENTQDNLFSLVALADYARTKKAQPAGRVLVELDGKKLLDAKLGGGKNAVRRARVPFAALKAGKLTISPTGGGPVTWSARIRYAHSLERVEAVESGFTITRSFEDPETAQPRTAPLKAGDVVRVLLTVHTSEERNHVAMVDRLAAGLEPINPRLGNPVDEEEENDRDWRRRRETRWVAMEMHDDRVALFAEQMTPGDHTFDYLVRATSAGQFLQPAATVEEMYRPEHHARTASATLEVKVK